MPVRTFYHYTSEQGKNGIRYSKKIKMSTAGIYGRHGNGVYFTTITPDMDVEEIAKNNYYSPHGTHVYKIYRVKYYIAVDIDTRNALLNNVSTYRQNIWIYRGEMNLDHFFLSYW